MKVQQWTVALAAIGCGTSAASALDFDQVITEGTVGSGDRQAMVVVDWNGGATPSHAWQFRWNDDATFADALNAIETAFSSFDWSNAAFVTELDYEDHVGNRDGWMSFWHSADGEAWQTNNLGLFDHTLSDQGWVGANAAGIAGNWPGGAPAVPAPEPATALLLSGAAAALVLRRERRAR